MEIRLKSLIYPGSIIVLAALLIVGLAALNDETEVATATDHSAIPQPLSSPIKTAAFPKEPPIGQTPVGRVQISAVDQSDSWDWRWQAMCRPMLDVYLGKRFPMQSLEVALVDDPTLSLGVAYPALGDAKAIAQSDCQGANGELFCQVTVGVGEPGAEMDMAITTAMVYAINEYHRPSDRESWESAGWDWNLFTPLIQEKEGAWTSNCLTLTAS